MNFTKKDLRDNEVVNFSVICAGENQTLLFEQEITPQYKDLNTDFVDKGLWIMDNLTFIFGGVIFLVILLAFIVMFVRAGQ